jgi:3-isopropylmalate/(R)-2-methylmalate dehydratase small subunit
MSGNERRVVAARGLPLPGDDIDTDRIIPARYLTRITFDDLGTFAFQDERFDAEGLPRSHPFNDPRYAGAGILIVGRNFGCGSSRTSPRSAPRRGGSAISTPAFPNP